MKNITFGSPVVGLAGVVWLSTTIHHMAATPNLAVMGMGAIAAIVCAVASANSLKCKI